MKLTAIILLTACLAASAKGHSQNVTITLKDVSLEKAFAEIKRQTGYGFVYKTDLLEHASRISISVKNATLQQVLDLCLKDQPLSYKVFQGFVVVKGKDDSIDDGKISLLPPLVNVHGKIVNEKGEPVAGASIVLKGNKTKGAATNSSGVFSLDVNSGDVLIISYVGYESVEYKITPAIVASSDQSFTVILKRSDSPLDDVQIVAYGTTTRRQTVGSIAKISAETIEQQPIGNPLEALEGRVPGLYVQTQNGLPGGTVSVQIRGQNSITAGLNPLYIIDGVPFTSAPLNFGPGINAKFNVINGPASPLNSIPPGEIESIEILKDADATAIYGSRGSNGVIIITTKHAKTGKTKVDINLNEGATSMSRYADFLNLKDYLTLSREGYENDGTVPSSDPNSSNYAPFLTVWDTTKSTDWQKFIFGNIDHVTQVNASISGGNENTQFVVGGNFRKEGSILPGDCHYTRSGIYMNVVHNYHLFHSTFSMSYTADDNNLLAYSSAVAAVRLPPNYPIYNPDGSLNWYSNNPIAYLKQKSGDKTSNLLVNGALQYDILPNLNIKTSIGYTKISSDMVVTNPASSQNPAYGIPSTSDFGNHFNRNFLIEPIAEYHLNIGSKAKIKFLVGSTYQETLDQFWTITANYTSDAFLDQLSRASSIAGYANTYNKYKYFSVYALGNLIWQDRYMLNLTGRRDGSSKFGPENEYGNFGSVGVGWVFTKEPFMQHLLPVLNFGKLRGSYGVTGNDQITAYQYYSTYSSSGSTVYQGQSVLTPRVVANGQYAWERNRKANLGIDLSFFKDKILLTTDFFLNRCDNLLVSYPLPYTSGPFGSYQANLPAKIENKGFELSLTSTNIGRSHFQWQTTFNISVLRNKLVAFPNMSKTAYANTYTVGKDLSVIKGFDFLGVDPQSGVAKFLDVNNDGSISAITDYVDIGKRSPDYFGGLGNNFKLNNFQLNIFLQFVGQHSITGASELAPPILYFNSYTNILARWQKPGDITQVQRATELGNAAAVSGWQNLPSSSAAIFNASYCRLKNISLSYSLPKRIIDKAHLQQFRFYLQGQNLFVLTKDKNVDPETVSGNSGGNYTVPVLKSIVAGIQITL